MAELVKAEELLPAGQLPVAKVPGTAEVPEAEELLPAGKLLSEELPKAGELLPGVKRSRA